MLFRSLKLKIYEYLSLLRADGVARTKFQLVVLVWGCALLACHEINLTSVILAPSPPLVYETLRELLGAGYKISVFNNTAVDARDSGCLTVAPFCNGMEFWSKTLSGALRFCVIQTRESPRIS